MAVFESDIGSTAGAVERVIIFTIIGFIIGIVIKNDNTAMGVIIAVSILWAFAMEPWAIATFIELLLGYSLARKIL